MKDKFIKVTIIASGLSSIVPAGNKPHYEQANDLEKKAKKSPIYKIEEPSEKEVAEYYPELASGKTKTAPNVEHTKAIEAKDAEINDLSSSLEKSTKEVESKSKEIEAKDAEIKKLKDQLANKNNQK